MFEKVNPSHPDKVADRIAGAIVDYAYTLEHDPKIAVEVLIGHGDCNIITESNVIINDKTYQDIVDRIAGEGLTVYLNQNIQDVSLSKNQVGGLKCGDNGIFKGVPISREEMRLTTFVKCLYRDYPFDGKFIINNDIFTICQSNVSTKFLKKQFPDAIINPLGDWTGGVNVDSGATNRKLGSDMGASVTGGGLHGKDLSKADVTLNIYAYLKAQLDNSVVELSCNIGDKTVDGKPYPELVEIARKYITDIGGFEKFAEWGLIR